MLKEAEAYAKKRLRAVKDKSAIEEFALSQELLNQVSAFIEEDLRQIITYQEEELSWFKDAIEVIDSCLEDIQIKYPQSNLLSFVRAHLEKVVASGDIEQAVSFWGEAANELLRLEKR